MDLIYIIYSNTGFESKFGIIFMFILVVINILTVTCIFFHPENGSIFVELNL